MLQTNALKKICMAAVRHNQIEIWPQTNIKEQK